MANEYMMKQAAEKKESLRTGKIGKMFRPFEEGEDGKEEEDAVINDIFKELEKLNSFNF